ncbi:MAG: hypothetical protein DWQ01_08460 [Planctomycetota bacterium]|nr:MAG: hypothetical protein DWQ01_08460 [Planctomycetota bacterium]
MSRVEKFAIKDLEKLIRVHRKRGREFRVEIPYAVVSPESTRRLAFQEGLALEVDPIQEMTTLISPTYRHSPYIRFREPALFYLTSDSYDSTSGFLSFPKIWNLLGYLLPRSIREESWEDCVVWLKDDFYESMEKYESKGARAWIYFCLTFQTLWQFAGCFGVMLGDRTGQAIRKLLPEAWRRFWWP